MWYSRIHDNNTNNDNNNSSPLLLIIHLLLFPPRMTLCGTAEYMAPELMFDEESYSFEIDVYSFGMVLLEVLKRQQVGHNGFAERSPNNM